MQNRNNISISSLIDNIPDRTGKIDCAGFSGSEKAYLVARLYARHRSPIVLVAATQKEAERLIDDLDFFVSTKPPVTFFPAYNILPFKKIAYHNQTAALRISALYRLLNYDIPPIAVTTPGALLQKIIPKNIMIFYRGKLVILREKTNPIKNIMIQENGYVRAKNLLLKD